MHDNNAVIIQCADFIADAVFREDHGLNNHAQRA